MVLEKKKVKLLKVQMESDLEAIKRAHEEAKDQLDNIKKQTKEEKKRRAKESLKVTQGIASERENLVKELDDLRSTSPIHSYSVNSASIESAIIKNYMAQIL